LTRKTGIVSFSINGLPASASSVEVFDENRLIAINSGSFRDNFQQMAMPIYFIGLAGNGCGLNCPECVSMARIVDYVFQWRRGSLSMASLMQKINSWKTAANCP
jgi:hypothetical protein